MKAIALLGGPKISWPIDMKDELIKAREEGTFIIGVDRGSLLLEELNLTPDLAVGDFDSLRKEELLRINQSVSDIRYSVPEKDLTDTELALHYAFDDYCVDSLSLIGATGGRLDHFLTNLFMLLKPEFRQYAEKIQIIDQQNYISFLNPGKHVVKRIENYTYFGVATLNEVQELNISNAKYNLACYSNTNPVSLSSNEFLHKQDTFNVSFKKGLIAIIQSRDLDRFQNIQK